MTVSRGDRMPVSPRICFGCKACMVVCPNNAIKMAPDEEGFLYPVKNRKKCGKCGRCERSCPALSPFASRRPRLAYAVKVKDAWVRCQSSSGGVFSALAKQCLAQGGVVCGAGFEKGTWRVVHKAVSSESGLDDLRGSKYVQSDVDLQAMREVVASGRRVVFVGTPCQVSALKHVVGDRDNLLAVDLVCHGVSSPLAWERYLNQRKEGAGLIKRIHMRNKQPGWNVFSQRIDFEDGSLYRASLYEDAFLRGFLGDIYLRPSCHDCLCREHRSGSDLTMGDYWGVSQFHPGLADDDGVSALMVNTEKGQTAIDQVEQSLVSEATEIQHVVAGNPALTKSPKRPAGREEFFKVFKTMPFDSAVDLALNRRLRKDPKRIGILTFHSQLNYGGVLQCSALRTAIKGLARPGTEVFVIDRWMKPGNQALLKGFSPENKISFEMGCGRLSPEEVAACYHGRVRRTVDFIDKHLNLTNVHFLDWGELSPNDIRQLSLDLIVVGSDQVWHCGDWGDPRPYLLEGCPRDVPAISYAASFGVRKLGRWASKFQQTLKRFSAISCRELDGVELCSEIGYTAEHAIDPVGLVDFKEWMNALGMPNRRIKRDGLLFYGIGEDVERSLDELSSFAAKHGCTVTVLVDSLKKSWLTNGIAVPNKVKIDLAAGPVEFIQAFRRARWVVTDSFHALLFSIVNGVDVRILRPVRDSGRGVMFARIEEFAKGFRKSVVVDSVHEALVSLDRAGNSNRYDESRWKELKARSRQYLLDALKGRGRSVKIAKAARGTSVSVIVPVYNAESYLRQMLTSLAAQTLENIEVICIDDGSTDGSLSICNDIAAKDARFKVLSQPHLGAAVARNRGIGEAKGKWLFFADADDFCKHEMLEEMVKAGQCGNHDVVVAGRLIVDCRHNGRVQEQAVPAEFLGREGNVSCHTDGINVFSGLGFAPWNKLFRRAFIVKKGIEFHNIPTCDDAFFVFASLIAAKSISFVGKSYYYYRANLTNSQMGRADRAPTNFLAALQEIRQLLDKQSRRLQRQFYRAAIFSCFDHLFAKKTSAGRRKAFSALQKGGLASLGFPRIDTRTFDFGRVKKVFDLTMAGGRLADVIAEYYSTKCEGLLDANSRIKMENAQKREEIQELLASVKQRDAKISALEVKLKALRPVARRGAASRPTKGRKILRRGEGGGKR